ncbi:MarR family protein [Nakamurella panacisegetis]|uniref:MarR family protein n=1 Tax=Nakamurella panacisegetis TaxID=1090615 RepID=A0A1H0LIY1_9ACTN|nr:MarR family protein [Nakamurella panacisegetis]
MLRLSALLVDGIQHGVAEGGFDDVRPVHGFAFARLSEAPATTAQLAEHLGITKQATSELVHYLLDRGYLTRVADPHDRRAWLLVLTGRGHDCTRAAQRAATRTVEGWEQRISPGQATALREALAAVAGEGRLRPAW